MTKQDLLKASIREFEDKKNNALLWKCKRVFTTSGYAYLVKQTSTPISCAFHFAKTFETSEEIGKYENVEIALNTRQQIPFDDCVITYAPEGLGEELCVALLSQGNYNETMGQWHYRGVGTFGVISHRFLVADESEISDNLGVNSMQIILELQADYPYVPSYFEAKSEKQYVMVDVEEQGVMGGILAPQIATSADGTQKQKLTQWKRDAVKLTFVNFTRDEALKELNRVMQSSLSKETQFGFCTTPNLSNKYLYQMAFNWKSLTYISEFEINYLLRESASETAKRVLQIIYKALETI